MAAVGAVWPGARAGADALVRGRVALLGDAAHPMLPCLAQGRRHGGGRRRRSWRARWPWATLNCRCAWRRYALNRWQRVAQVQRCAAQQAHLSRRRPAAPARDASLRLLGPRLLEHALAVRPCRALKCYQFNSASRKYRCGLRADFDR